MASQTTEGTLIHMGGYYFVISLQLPPPRLVYKLFAGGKVMQLVIFQFSIKFVVVVVDGYGWFREEWVYL